MNVNGEGEKSILANEINFLLFQCFRSADRKIFAANSKNLAVKLEAAVFAMSLERRELSHQRSCRSFLLLGISQPGLRIDTVHLCRDDHAVHGRRASSAPIGSTEESGFSLKILDQGPAQRPPNIQTLLRTLSLGVEVVLDQHLGPSASAVASVSCCS